MTTYYKGKIGKEDIEFGGGTFLRRDSSGAFKSFTQVNANDIPLWNTANPSLTGKVLMDLVDGGQDVEIYPMNVFSKHTTGTMVGNETIAYSDGKVFFKNPGTSNRNLNPNNTFITGHELIIINTSSTKQITFDSTGIALVIQPNSVAGFIRSDTAWICQFLYPNSQTSLNFTSAPSANLTSSGIYSTRTVGENVVFGDVLYLKAADSKLWKANAATMSTMPIVCMAGATIAANEAGITIEEGIVRNDSWNWTVGGLIYAKSTAGQIVQSGSETVIQVVGYALTADIMYFKPSLVFAALSSVGDWFDQSVKTTASPTFANITDSGLTANRIVVTDGSKVLTSGTAGSDITISAGVVTINSNAITQAKMDDNSVGTNEIIDANVTQAKLKTSSGSVNSGSDTNLTLPGGVYGFYPQIQGGGGSCSVTISTVGGGGSYLTCIDARTISSPAFSAQQYYVTSSGEVHWIFLLKEKSTGKVISSYEAHDHPSFGNKGVKHPFNSYDENIHDIVVINPTLNQVKQIELARVNMAWDVPDRNWMDVFNELYEVDELKEATWPDIPITVGLPKVDGKGNLVSDWRMKPEGTVLEPVKRVIVKPDFLTVLSIKAKK